MGLLKLGENKRRRDAARDGLFTSLERIVHRPADVRAFAVELRGAGTLAALRPRARTQVQDDLIRRYASEVLDDDRVTADEESALTSLVEALDMSPEEFGRRHPDLVERMLIAALNDRRLPTVDDPDLIVKRGEIVHFQGPARLMREVTIREYRGGSRGVSVRIAKGVSYRVGAHRGRVVPVGTELQVHDNGTLSVTSRRAVFAGSRRTLQFDYAKLVDLEVYTDGLRLGVSNRQTPSVLLTGYPDYVAALINTAMNELDA